MFFRVAISDLARYEALDEARFHQQRAEAVQNPRVRARERSLAQEARSEALRCPATVSVFMGNDNYILSGGQALTGLRGRGSAELPLLTPIRDISALEGATLRIAIDPGTRRRRVTMDIEESNGTIVPICDGEFEFEYAGHVPNENEFVFLVGALHDHYAAA